MKLEQQKNIVKSSADVWIQLWLDPACDPTLIKARRKW